MGKFIADYRGYPMKWTTVVVVTIVSLFATPLWAQDRDARMKAAFEQLDAYVARAMRDNHVPGLSLALTDRNGLLYAKTYGYADTKLQKPVTRDTEFEIGSISKSFTAISLLQLAESGKFDPHQPITKYLPWFSIHSNYQPL